MLSFPAQPNHHSAKHASSNGGSSDSVYDAKYRVLTRKCMQVKEETDRIYSNLLRSKKVLRKLLHERRLLAERLERYGDQFCDVDLPQFCDEDFTYELLIAQRKAANDVTSPATPTGSMGSSSTSLSRRGSSSSQQPLQQTPPLVSSGFFDSLDSSSTSKLTKKKSTSGTPRAKKDPEAPRKPVNAYFIFCEHRRADVQRQMVEERHGEVDRKEVTKKLSQLWLELAHEEKKMFYTLYEAEKNRYDAEMKEYSATRQPSLVLPSATNPLMGLPPPFSSAEEDVLLGDQPPAKRPKKAGSRNGPGRPPFSGSGSATPNVLSNDCSPSPPTDCNSNNGIATDALLASTSEPITHGSNLLSADSMEGAVGNNSMTEDETGNHLQSSSEDVFLLEGNGDGIESLGMPTLPTESCVGGDNLLLSTTTTGDDSGESNGGAASLGTNGNGNAGHASLSPSQSQSSTSPHSGSSQLPTSQQGMAMDSTMMMALEQPSPPTTSNEWQPLPRETTNPSGATDEEPETHEGDNNSSTLNASSSTLSPIANTNSGGMSGSIENVPPVELLEPMVVVEPQQDIEHEKLENGHNDNVTNMDDVVMAPPITESYSPPPLPSTVSLIVPSPQPSTIALQSESPPEPPQQLPLQVEPPSQVEPMSVVEETPVVVPENVEQVDKVASPEVVSEVVAACSEALSPPQQTSTQDPPQPSEQPSEQQHVEPEQPVQPEQQQVEPEQKMEQQIAEAIIQEPSAPVPEVVDPQIAPPLLPAVEPTPEPIPETIPEPMMPESVQEPVPVLNSTEPAPLEPPIDSSCPSAPSDPAPVANTVEIDLASIPLPPEPSASFCFGLPPPPPPPPPPPVIE